jgi:hypothetical protein
MIENGVIEQGIAAPDSKKKVVPPLNVKYAFRDLEVGESCVITAEGKREMHNLRAAISQLAKYHDRSFTTRSVALRVWRLS